MTNEQIIKLNEYKTQIVEKANEMNEIIKKCYYELKKYPRIDFYLDDTMEFSAIAKLTKFNFRIEYTI